MGIGFKSVFGRFREARISGWGWTFRYEITQSVGGEYGDVQTDPLGAVMPIWDPGIERPEDGFTTRFELCMRRDRSANLNDDLGRFVSHRDLTTALQRLASTGSQLPASELANLLRDVRAQVSTDVDKRRFKQAVLELSVESDGGDRVSVSRVVRRVGGHRGALGGWITPMSRLHETSRDEFEHPEFPLEIPETTTGDQALDYILDVWTRARSSPERLANSVREVLPSAYAYCLDDCSDDSGLSERWSNAVADAIVFSEREWIVVADANNVFYDDVEDRRFIPDTALVRTCLYRILLTLPASGFCVAARGG